MFNFDAMFYEWQSRLKTVIFCNTLFRVIVRRSLFIINMYALKKGR